jgi:hypothetical protein
MNLTTIIILNAILDLAVVFAVFAVVRLTHRLHRYDHLPETLHPSQPIPLSLAIPQHEAEELAEAA